MPSDDRIDRQLRAMALLSTLRTAAEVRHAIAERRAGRDPSGQEAKQPVRAYLYDAHRESTGLLLRLRTSLAVEADEGVALVHAFEDRMVLARAARVLHVAHQRLLSLYPEVTPEVVEAARLRQREAAQLAGASGPAFREALAGFTGRFATFLELLAKALQAPN